MVEYLSGGRIQGQSTETSADPTPSVGGWKQVGRTTLGSNSATITVASLPYKSTYRVIVYIKGVTGGSGNNLNVRFGNSSDGSVDSGNNYAFDYMIDNAATAESNTQGKIKIFFNISGTVDHEYFGVGDIVNNASQEKLWTSTFVAGETDGAGTIPTTQRTAGKWTGSAAIDTIQIHHQNASANFLTGSEVIVLGFDSDDTHTDNFWERIAYKTQTTAAATLTTDTFAAKKYLQVHLWSQNNVSGSYGGQPEFKVGTGTIDTGSNYAMRINKSNSDDARASQGRFGIWAGTSQGVQSDWDLFIVNFSGKEKYCVGRGFAANTVGSDSDSWYFSRFSGKWTGSGQITQLQLTEVDSGQGINVLAGSKITVWGSD